MNSEVAIRPPVFQTALYSWATTLNVIKRMPGVFLATWIATWPLESVSPWWRASFDDDFSWAAQAVELLCIVLRALVATPLAIAVHRFALLGEVAHIGSLGSHPARFRRFFVFALVFEVALALPLTVDVVRHVLMLSESVEAVLYLAILVATLAVFIIALHVLLVFPAIAIDAANATWRAAISDSRGKSARIFVTVVVICIPLLLTYVPYAFHFEPEGRMSFAQAAAFGLVDAAISVLTISLYAAMASRLYLAFGRRLGRPEGLSFPLSAPT